MHETGHEFFVSGNGVWLTESVPPQFINLGETTRAAGSSERGGVVERFYVKAASVNQVRRALGRAPGGARVVGRFDREMIECRHTMDEHSFARHWPVIVSRLEGAGLAVVERPDAGQGWPLEPL
jgi:hypothetical protein